ncbi:MAG: carbohydrate ABC transporter permease [Kineosporiaceae bacterium]
MTAATPTARDAGVRPARGSAPPARRRKRSRWSLAAMIAGYTVLTFFAFVYLFPFVIQIATSVKTNADATQNSLDLIPDPFTVDAYRRLFQADFPLWFWNSVVVTLFVTAGRVFFNALAGYALARLPFAGRTLLFGGILAVIAVPPIILLIPKFLVLRELGIWDTYPALVVPLVADAAGIFIMKQFFESIPVSVEEAARIDGAGTFRTFWSVVLPMARPALLTITILAFQGSWNEFPHFLIASQDPDLYTLTKGVATLTTGGLGSGNQFPITLAAGLIMTIPVAIIFFVFQRYFVRGATAGAEKG